MERTIVVFKADHGDLRGEHHRQNKGVPYEASARIPFVIYYPAKINAARACCGTGNEKSSLTSEFLGSGVRLARGSSDLAMPVC
jgi:glucan phosphoethanolaminetransferase (alkaline phosphatase superfamily)